MNSHHVPKYSRCGPDPCGQPKNDCCVLKSSSPLVSVGKITVTKSAFVNRNRVSNVTHSGVHLWSYKCEKASDIHLRSLSLTLTLGLFLSFLSCLFVFFLSCLLTCFLSCLLSFPVGDPGGIYSFSFLWNGVRVFDQFCARVSGSLFVTNQDNWDCCIMIEPVSRNLFVQPIDRLESTKSTRTLKGPPGWRRQDGEKKEMEDSKIRNRGNKKKLFIKTRG